MLSKYQPNKNAELPIDYNDLLDLNKRHNFHKHQDLTFYEDMGDMMRKIKLSQIVWGEIHKTF